MDIEIVTLELVTDTTGEPGRTARFDPEPLRNILRRRRVVRVDHHVHDFRGQPLVTFVLETADETAAEEGEAPSPTSMQVTSVGEAGIAAPARPAPKRASDWARDLPAEHRDLFAALRDWRNDTAREEGQSAFLVLSNRTLAELALARPRTPEALLEVRGMGPSKVERYGEAIMALVAACDEEVTR